MLRIQKAAALLLLSIFLFTGAGAQTYYQVTHTTGTQTVGSNSVTVTATSLASTFGAYCSLPSPNYFCGAGPSALGYKYEFSSPVNKLRMHFAGQNTGEIISFIINGSQYNITSANILPYTGGCSFAGTPAAINGNLEVTGTSMYANCLVEINTVTPIDSIRVHHNGSYSLAGTVYDFWFAADSMIYITEPFNDTSYCSGDSVHVPYTVAAKFATNNVFTLQLSDASGSFASPTNIGTLPYDSSATIHGKIPLGMPSGTGYKLRIIGSNPSKISAPTIKNIIIKPTPTPLAAVNGPICEGDALTITASALSGSAFSWTGPASFTSTQQNNSIPNATTANSGDYIVTATLNGCSAKDTVTATVKTMPAVPTAGNNGPVCEGASLNLTANSTTNGATYSWTGPGSYTAALQNPSLPNAIPSQSGTYYVTASLNGCTSAAASTAATIKPLPAAPVAGNNTPICAGGTLNLTANSSTSGVTYNWIGPNGFTSTTQNPSIPAATLADTGLYTVTATLNGCISATAGSTTVVINEVSAIGGWVSPNDTVCDGTQATFVVVPTNAGPNPQYQWFRNTMPIAGANGTVLVTSAIADGDSFYCRLMAPNVCLQTLVVYSNGIVMHVLPVTTTPSVNIVSTPATPQPGQNISFYANVLNGGYQPTFQWQRNGQNVFGAIHANWSASNLNPFDKINCIVTSSDPCATPKIAYSDTVTINFPTTINEMPGGNGLAVYPNPNNGNFTIKGSVLQNRRIVISIANIIGQTVYRDEVVPVNYKVQKQVNLPGNVANGIYMLKLDTAGDVKVARFTVNR